MSEQRPAPRTETDEAALVEANRLKQQRLRSIAIAAALLAMAVIFFVVTIIRLGGSVADRGL